MTLQGKVRAGSSSALDLSPATPGTRTAMLPCAGGSVTPPDTSEPSPTKLTHSLVQSTLPKLVDFGAPSVLFDGPLTTLLDRDGPLCPGRFEVHFSGFIA